MTQFLFYLSVWAPVLTIKCWHQVACDTFTQKNTEQISTYIRHFISPTTRRGDHFWANVKREVFRNCTSIALYSLALGFIVQCKSTCYAESSSCLIKLFRHRLLSNSTLDKSAILKLSGWSLKNSVLIILPPATNEIMLLFYHQLYNESNLTLELLFLTTAKVFHREWDENYEEKTVA